MQPYTELRPHVVFTPKIFIDGDQWCALYGENLMVGISGFGRTPQEAVTDFENNFTMATPPVEKGDE